MNRRDAIAVLGVSALALTPERDLLRGAPAVAILLEKPVVRRGGCGEPGEAGSGAAADEVGGGP